MLKLIVSTINSDNIEEFDTLQTNNIVWYHTLVKTIYELYFGFKSEQITRIQQRVKDIDGKFTPYGVVNAISTPYKRFLATNLQLDDQVKRVVELLESHQKLHNSSLKVFY